MKLWIRKRDIISAAIGSTVALPLIELDGSG
jgi:hypothetical protein